MVMTRVSFKLQAKQQSTEMNLAALRRTRLFLKLSPLHFDFLFFFPKQKPTKKAMIWALYSLFSSQKDQRHLPSDRKSVNSLHFSFIQQSSKSEGLSLSPEIVLKVMSYLDAKTASNLLLLNQKWSFDACEAFYHSPRLNTAASFPRLIRMLTSRNTYHPYAWLIRDLTFKGTLPISN